MSWEGLPATLPAVSLTIHRALMCNLIFPAQSFLLLFRSELANCLIPPHVKLNMSRLEHLGFPHLKTSASLGFSIILSPSKTYLLTHSLTLTLTLTLTLPTCFFFCLC